MANPRMHISPLASERHTADMANAFCAEAGGMAKFLGQFTPNVIMAEDYRLLYGLTAIEDAPLPDDLPKLSPRSYRNGSGVARAIGSVELANMKIKPFTHGEHASNTPEGERIEVPAFHLGPVAAYGFHVLPKDDACSKYTVAAGRITTTAWTASPGTVSYDVPGVELLARPLDGDLVVYLEIPVQYGMGLPYDAGDPNRIKQVSIRGAPVIGLGRSDTGSFSYLPKQVVSLGWPNDGVIYIALAFVNGGKIFQPEYPSVEAYVGNIHINDHTFSVPRPV